MVYEWKSWRHERYTYVGGPQVKSSEHMTKAKRPLFVGQTRISIHLHPRPANDDRTTMEGPYQLFILANGEKGIQSKMTVSDLQITSSLGHSHKPLGDIELPVVIRFTIDPKNKRRVDTRRFARFEPVNLLPLDFSNNERIEISVTLTIDTKETSLTETFNHSLSLSRPSRQNLSQVFLLLVRKTAAYRGMRLRLACCGVCLLELLQPVLLAVCQPCYKYYVCVLIIKKASSSNPDSNTVTLTLWAKAAGDNDESSRAQKDQ